MNTSGHVVTRNQLNQITKTNIPNQAIQNQASGCNSKQQQINDEERKKQKIEKERMERQKRLEKRNKMLERVTTILDEESPKRVQKRTYRDLKRISKRHS